MKKKQSSYRWLLWLVIWLVALKVVPDSMLGIILFAPLIFLIYRFRNKIIDYHNESNIWKQGFIIGIFIFVAMIIYSIITLINSSGDMSGLAIFIPFLFFEFLTYKYIHLKLLFTISFFLSLVLYYVLGLIISILINIIKKIIPLKKLA